MTGRIKLSIKNIFGNWHTSQDEASLTNNALAQAAASQGLVTSTSAGGTINVGALGAAGGVTSPYWGTIPAMQYIPTIDPKSVIVGTEIKIEDLITRLAELEEKFKNLKFMMELKS